MEKCEKLDYNSSSGAPEKVSFEFKEGYLDIVRVSSVPNLKMKDLSTCKGAKGDDEHLVDLLAPLSVVGVFQNAYNSLKGCAGGRGPTFAQRAD